VTPEVEEAITEIRKHFVGASVLVGPDGQGGACVIVDSVELGASFEQGQTWIGFHITHFCPYADVYPHFIRGDLSRRDKSALGQGFSGGHTFPLPGVVTDKSMPGRSAVQVSRRANRRDAESALETPLIKALKVLRWLNSL
jgi:hypothetical protein